MNKNNEDVEKLINCIITNISEQLEIFILLSNELAIDYISIELKYKILKDLFKKYDLNMSCNKLDDFENYLNNFLYTYNKNSIYLEKLLNLTNEYFIKNLKNDTIVI